MVGAITTSKLSSAANAVAFSTTAAAAATTVLPSERRRRGAGIAPVESSGDGPATASGGTASEGTQDVRPVVAPTCANHVRRGTSPPRARA